MFVASVPQHSSCESLGVFRIFQTFSEFSRIFQNFSKSRSSHAKCLHRFKNASEKCIFGLASSLDCVVRGPTQTMPKRNVSGARTEHFDLFRLLRNLVQKKSTVKTHTVEKLTFFCRGYTVCVLAVCSRPQEIRVGADELEMDSSVHTGGIYGILIMSS